MRRLFLTLSGLLSLFWLVGCAALVSKSSPSSTDPNQPPPPQISVTITDKFSGQIVGGPAITVNATVSNDPSNAGVRWALTAGGVSCSPACGSLTPAPAPSLTALYSPPSTLPASPNNSPSITATSLADTSASDAFTFSLSFSSGALSGNYVYLLRGFGPGGQPAAIEGVVDFDSQGNIVGGRVDLNVAGQITSSTSLTGNYLVDTSFNGVTRATINVTNVNLPGTSSSFGMKCVLSADGTRGRVIEYDGSGFLTAGTVQQQNPAVLAAGVPTGSFAFALDSDSSSGSRVVEAGQFVLGSAGIISGVVDQSEAGNPSPVYSGTAITAAPTTLPDPNGRGTLTITIEGNSTQYAYYIVNAGQFDLIETDNGNTFSTVQAGIARLQNALTVSSVNSTSVLQMTGVDRSVANDAIGPAVLIGVMSIAGNSFNLTSDSNDAGTVLTTHPTSGEIVSFDPSAGRGVISVPNGAQQGFINTGVFYLFAAGTGFLIDADLTTPAGTPATQSVVNKAYSGTFSPQTAGPFGGQSLSGNSISLTGASPIPAIPDIVMATNFASAAGSFSAIADVASLPSQIGDSANRTFTDGFQITDLTLGHGNMTLPAGFFDEFDLNQPAPATFYLVGANQFVLIGTLSGADSGVTFFDPQ